MTTSRARPVATLIRLAATTAAFGGALFLLAGTPAWPAAWAYLVLVVAILGAYSMIVATRHPDLIQERTKPPADAKTWDKPFVLVVGAIGPVAMIVVCGLDRRYRWSAPISSWMKVAGLLVVAAGGVLSNCAVAANRFFSMVVRIQRDRGHQVVDSGPYRVVRHPGYVGSILTMFGMPLALGSRWGLTHAAMLMLLIVVRTALEDRTLGAELEGYSDYARRVRFRLVPWLW
jgi:protein-S-isoprenylcysteine O-methyltransferase Ste14